MSPSNYMDAKGEVLGVWSAILPLPDYGRVARHPPV